MSAKPIELIRNSSRFCCSSTMELLSRMELSMVRDQVGRRIAVGGERRHSCLDVVGQVRQARVDLGQKRIEVRKGLADLLAAAVERRRDRAEGLVEFRRVDLVQHGDELLEDGVDLGGDVLALDHLSPCSFCGEGSVGGTSSTYLAPNTVDDVMSTPTLDGNQVQLRRVHVQLQHGRAVGLRRRSRRPCRPRRHASSPWRRGSSPGRRDPRSRSPERFR